jgi:CopG family transcriptional regulator, nickel-responsive regulator
MTGKVPVLLARVPDASSWVKTASPAWRAAAAEARGYQNRPEIIRDLARAGLQQSAEDAAVSGECVAALVYVYDHSARDLSRRLVQNFHGHHDLSLATLHVHLDDDHCMEVTALKGSSSDVKHLADHVIAERGVRYGRVVMIPTAPEKKGRRRGHEHSH